MSFECGKCKKVKANSEASMVIRNRQFICRECIEKEQEEAQIRIDALRKTNATLDEVMNTSEKVNHISIEESKQNKQGRQGGE